MGFTLRVVGWIPLVPKTLQSLGATSSADHQELQCHLHNPDIESRTTCGVWSEIIGWVSGLWNGSLFFRLSINCMICSLFKLAYPSSFMVFCVFSTFAMIVLIEWREQIKVQVKAHFSRTDGEWVPRRSSAIVATCFSSKCLGCFVTSSDVGCTCWSVYAFILDDCIRLCWPMLSSASEPLTFECFV